MSAPAAASSSSNGASASASSSSVVATPATASSATSATSPTIHNFSFTFVDSLYHVQIWFLASSLFVWIGDQHANMHSLTLAIQSAMDKSPSTSCLIGHGRALGNSGDDSAAANANAGGGEEDQSGIGMASRIASIFSLPVFVSLNLTTVDAIMPGGGSGPELQTFIERTVVKELRVCKQLGMFKTQ